MATIHKLKLVGFDRENHRPSVIDSVYAALHSSYQGKLPPYTATVREDWYRSLEEQSVETILFIADKVMKGRTNYSSKPPTPIEFACMCEHHSNHAKFLTGETFDWLASL